jgi:dihydroneopterin aldolase
MPITSARILLENFAVNVDIGIHDFERGQPQRVLVSVEMEVDVDPTGAGDDIERVLDYDFVRTEILELVKTRRFNLQETFCHAIIQIIAERSAVRWVRATTRKPDVYEDCEADGFSLLYER